MSIQVNFCLASDWSHIASMTLEKTPEVGEVLKLQRSPVNGGNRYRVVSVGHYQPDVLLNNSHRALVLLEKIEKEGQS